MRKEKSLQHHALQVVNELKQPIIKIVTPQYSKVNNSIR